MNILFSILQRYFAFEPKYSPENQNKEFNKMANFYLVPQGIVYVIISLLFVSWKDTLRRENCNKQSGCDYNCCANPYLAPMYFFSFVLIAQFVLVNVVVAVLMKHLEESHKEQELDEEEEEAEMLRQMEAAGVLETEDREEEANNSDDGVRWLDGWIGRRMDR